MISINGTYVCCENLSIKAISKGTKVVVKSIVTKHERLPVVNFECIPNSSENIPISYTLHPRVFEHFFKRYYITNLTFDL